MSLNYDFADCLPDLGTLTSPTAISNAVLRLRNDALLQQLELPSELFDEQRIIPALTAEHGELCQRSMAQKYGGHQFGQWNPELGDGRGLLLGNTRDMQGNAVDLHLKGAGKTPYSRFGDGRAVLRSSIREYLASEALHAMGIPSSRALCLLSSDHPVMREYPETAALLVRTAPSHIRFGHFEYFYHSRQYQQLDQLFEFCFQHHFQWCLGDGNRYLNMLIDIVERTAEMIAHWQAQGFVHGVMNTDNMSIHGITFDFGPYGFLDNYNSQYTPNHTDSTGRYAFVQQPGVGLWNLNALAHGFSRYLDSEQIVSALSRYEACVSEHYGKLMRAKFGLLEARDQDQQLVGDLLAMLSHEQADYHRTFRNLLFATRDNDNAVFTQAFEQRDQANQWLNQYRQRISEQSPQQQLETMSSATPVLLLRNHYAQLAIDDAENGNYQTLEELLMYVSSPSVQLSEDSIFAQHPPASAQSIGLSCSS